MRTGYSYFEHTADVGVRAYGRTPGELFAQAAMGLAGVVCDVSKVRPVEIRSIELEAGDPGELLVAWLNEMLFYMDSESLLLVDFDIKMEGTRLRAVARGERMDPERHGLKGGIKAVTYHMLEVDLAKGCAQFLLDV
jgi:SHS2 domain-containing protein